jgi:GNAT superfamily N-acetyltransferase
MTAAATILRTALPADAERIHEIHLASVRGLCAQHYAPDIIEGWLLNRHADRYLEPIERELMFVAERTGVIAGFGGFEPGMVTAIFVDPAHSGYGVGRALLQHAVAMARRGHDGPIKIEATLNARDFYERAGFHEVLRSTTRRNHVDIAMVVMELV